MPAASAPAAAESLSPEAFAALMAPLGPFGRFPRIAAGVSGGPDSLALALLAADWARARGGDLLALIIDHGLRPGSAAEATEVTAMLAGQGISARVIALGMVAGLRLQERARIARRAALLAACAEAGRPWLLLGHQRGDQAETLLMRAAQGSGEAGLAAMAPVTVAAEALILRPLLGVPRARLEAIVASAGLTPVRDPSNADPRFARTRVRAALGELDGTGPLTAALAEATAAFGQRRTRREVDLAERLAATARLHPEGWAQITAATLDPAVLALLLQAVGGTAYAPPAAAVADLARRGAATLGGAWLRPVRGGWQVLRDPGAVASPVQARPGAVWDGRFRQLGPGVPGCTLGALGDEARCLGSLNLPAAVRAALPAFRQHGMLVAVPSLLYPDAERASRFAVVFCAPALVQVAGAPVPVIYG